MNFILSLVNEDIHLANIGNHHYISMIDEEENS